jgi:hypothetical protein
VWLCAAAVLLVCPCATAQEGNGPAAPVVGDTNGLREVPLAGRNYLDLLRHSSEVTRGQEGGNIEGYGPYAAGGNAGVNSLGQRGQNNNFLIDRMDNNENWLRGPILAPSLEVIDTVSLVAVSVPSDFGRLTGAAVSVRTRSGSNQLHAGLFDYLQNSAPNARNFFDGAAPSHLTQNQFGGNLSGPLQRNNWFLFASAESSREHRRLTVISTVPSAAQKAGSFGSVPIYDPVTIREARPVEFLRQPFPGNQIPPDRFLTPARMLIGLYPDPNLPGAFNNYRFTPTLVRGSDQYDFRTDKTLSARSTLLARASYGRRNVESPGALPGTAGSFAASDPAQHANATNTRLSSWGGIVSHTMTARPTLINEFRAAAARANLTAQAGDRGLDAASALSIPGLGTEGLPVVSPTGYVQLGAAGPVPFEIRTTNYQVEDTVQWTTGRHAWKFGVQVIRRHVDGTASEWTSRGTFLFTPDYTSQPGVDYTGNAIASLLTGYPAEVRRDVQFEPFRLRGWEWAGFVQDDIRVGRRLTIQAGVRYSPFPPVTEAGGRMVNFNYGRVTPALDQFAGQGGVNQYAGAGYKRWAIAPRFGFAWDLFGSGSTVLRGAFSQSYDTTAYIALGCLARNPPFAARQDIFNGSLQLGLRLDDGVPAPERAALLDPLSLNRARGAIYAVEVENYTPYSNQWGLFVQQHLRTGLTLEAGGMGSMGMHLPVSYDINQPYPAPAPYQWRRYPHEPYISRVEYLGFAAGSTYYGGQARLSGQLGAGLRVLLNYRYAKSLDDATAPGTSQQSRPSGPQYIYDLRGMRSPSSFDVTERLIATVIWELPVRRAGAGALTSALAGWHLSAVIAAQDGFPFTPELPVNGLNNGGIWLPNRIGDGSLVPEERSHLRWFNTRLDRADPQRAFETPPLYQYGNSGFNIVRGPGLFTVDAALSRSFQLGGGLRLRARIEGYNLANRTNFALPNRILGLDSSGAINHTATPSRQFQVSARLEW